MLDNVYRHQYELQSFDILENEKAAPHVLFRLLLNSAWKHVYDTRFNYLEMEKRNEFWVISKIFIEFYEYPKWNDIIDIQTWGKSIEKFYALRDFAVFSKEKKLLTAANSYWLIVDRERKRPKKLDELRKHFLMKPDYKININALEIKQIQNFNKMKEFCVSYTDIDINKHVNASVYLQWIYNSFPVEAMRKSFIKSVSIQFLAEAFAGSTVVVYTEEYSGESLFYHSIKDKDTNNEYCRAVTKWNQII